MYRKEPFRTWKKFGYVSKLDVWVPHQLTGTQLTHRISACDLLLKRLKNDLFFKKKTITGEEKLIVYNNIQRKRS